MSELFLNKFSPNWIIADLDLLRYLIALSPNMVLIKSNLILQ